MTTVERVQSVVDYGFTERQACFLVLVMRHAGLCVKRQYATFAGIANGWPATKIAPVIVAIARIGFGRFQVLT